MVIVSKRDDVDALIFLLHRVEEEPDPLVRIETIMEMQKWWERGRMSILRKAAYDAKADGHSYREIADVSGRNFVTVRDWVDEWADIADLPIPKSNRKRRGNWRDNLWHGKRPPKVWDQDRSGAQE